MLLNKKFLSSILAGCVSLLPMTACKASTSGETDLTEILENEPYFADDESSQDSEDQREYFEIVRSSICNDIINQYRNGLGELDGYVSKLQALSEQKKRKLFYSEIIRESIYIINDGKKFLKRLEQSNLVERRTNQYNPVEYYEFIEDLNFRLHEVSRILYFVTDEIRTLEGKDGKRFMDVSGEFCDDNGFSYYI